MSRADELSAPVERKPRCPEEGGVTLILPVHDEALVIEAVIRNYLAELAPRLDQFELLVAEDGSSDDTKAVLERLAAELPIELLTASERKGYQRSICDAVARAAHPWVFIVDSDYQFAAVDFWRLERHRRESDLILGRKIKRRDPRHRVFLSRVYNLLMRRGLDVPYSDMDTGFRLIRRGLLEKVASRVRHMSFFTAELVVRAHHLGYRILEVPVPHHERPLGRTSIFRLSALVGICWRQLVGMRALRRELAGAAESSVSDPDGTSP